MRPSSYLLILGVATYIGTWLVFGERALLDRDTELIWTDTDILRFSREYKAELPHLLCTDLTDRLAYKLYERSAQVLPPEECFGNQGEVLSRVESEVVAEEGELGLVVAVVDVEYPNPLLSISNVSIWYYGTDHVVHRGEALVWAFIEWLPIYRWGDEIG